MFASGLSLLVETIQMKNRKIVAFKTNEGVSYALTKRLLEKGKQFGLNAILPFNTDKLVPAEWVQIKCRYGCNKYNTSWPCPPWKVIIRLSVWLANVVRFVKSVHILGIAGFHKKKGHRWSHFPSMLSGH